MVFKPIETGLAEIVIIRKHYLHRSCPITWAFGVFVGEKLKGVLTVGKPCSTTVCSGVCGNDRAHDVYELNRLWLDDSLARNSESHFIGWCLRWFRKHHPNLILVSYADTEQKHVGFVYQATNWIYTGMSAPFSDKIKGATVERSPKHRYVWFMTEADKALLRWMPQPYPKCARSGWRT